MWRTSQTKHRNRRKIVCGDKVGQLPDIIVSYISASLIVCMHCGSKCNVALLACALALYEYNMECVNNVIHTIANTYMRFVLAFRFSAFRANIQKNVVMKYENVSCFARIITFHSWTLFTYYTLAILYTNCILRKKSSLKI